MKRLIYALFLVAIVNAVAGKSKIDSFKNLLNSSIHDTNQVNILIQLCHLERNYSTTEAIDYGNKALVLAEEINWNKGIALANVKIGNAYTNQGDDKKALEYYTKALDIYTQLEDRLYVEICETDIANNYSNLGDYPKALGYYQQSFSESEKLNDTIGIIANLNSIAHVFKTLGDYPKALDYYQKAELEAQISKDKYEIASVYNNTGDLYERLQDTDKALKFYNQSLQISKQINNNKLQARTLLNIGDLMMMHNSDSALLYVNEALEIDEKVGNDIAIGECEEQIGLMYEKKMSYDLALQKIEKARELFNKAGNKELLAANFNDAGMIFMDSMIFGKAEENFRNALVISQQIGIKETERDALKALSELYNKTKQPEKELTVYKEYVAIKDSLMNGEKAKAIALKEIEYNELKNKMDEENRKVAVERKHNLQLLGIAVFIITFIISVLLLSKIKLKPVVLKIMGVLALLLLFEFISLLIEPLLSKWTDDNPLYTFLALVAIASVLIPTHHKLEHWVKEHLAKKYHSSSSTSPSPYPDKTEPHQ